MLSDLVGTSNKFFRGLKAKGFILEKELKYFTYEYKSIRRLVILKYYIYYPKSRRGFQMSQEDQLFQTEMFSEQISTFLVNQLK